MTSEYGTIIDSLSPQCISRNYKSENYPITTHYLCLGARKTDKTGFPKFFRYEGFYRFFDRESLGPLERFRAGILDPVQSDDEARLRVLDRALTEGIIHFYDEFPDIGAIPDHLCIITARKSIQQDLDALMKETDSENLPSFSSRLKEYVSWLYRLEVSIVTEDIVKKIYRS